MSDARVLHLGRDVLAPRRARAFVRETVGPEVDDDVLQDALVLASELVTNAVVHAGTDSELEVRVGHGAVELRLSDGDPRSPAQRARLLGLPAQGRGMGLIAELALRWGVDSRSDGKTVWAVLSTS